MGLKIEIRFISVDEILTKQVVKNHLHLTAPVPACASLAGCGHRRVVVRMELLAMLKVHLSAALQHVSFEKLNNNEATSICYFMVFAAVIKRKKAGGVLRIKIEREL